MSLETRRTYFKDDWHCGTQGCGCWQNVDVEKDKALLAKVFKDDNGKPAEVMYIVHPKEDDAGKEARERKIYHVRVKRGLLQDDDLTYVAWHGFWLQWISAARKDILDLAFERIGIWQQENRQNSKN